MNELKLVAAFRNTDRARELAADTSGDLLVTDRTPTDHLPFAALVITVTDDLATILGAADTGVWLVCERTIKNQPLGHLADTGLPGCIGIFTLVARPDITPATADAWWRDRHAPLALEIHEAMTHYYQLIVLHTFAGPAWNGFALCCFHSE